MVRRFPRPEWLAPVLSRAMSPNAQPPPPPQCRCACKAQRSAPSRPAPALLAATPIQHAGHIRSTARGARSSECRARQRRRPSARFRLPVGSSAGKRPGSPRCGRTRNPMTGIFSARTSRAAPSTPSRADRSNDDVSAIGHQRTRGGGGGSGRPRPHRAGSARYWDRRGRRVQVRRRYRAPRRPAGEARRGARAPRATMRRPAMKGGVTPSRVTTSVPLGGGGETGAADHGSRPRGRPASGQRHCQSDRNGGLVFICERLGAETAPRR